MAYRIQYGGYDFRFPERFLPNFGQTSPVIAQLMDRDGGVFVAGRGPERVTMAQIPFSFSLRAQTPDLMFAERNRVTLLQGEDEQQLMVTPIRPDDRAALPCQDNAADHRARRAQHVRVDFGVSVCVHGC